MSKANAKPLKIVKRNDLVPICCHCGKKLTEVYSKSKGSGFIEGRDVMYFCPHCMKVLGFGQSRMI
jgi:hypothetical protein